MVTTKNLPISISQFASDVNLLNTPLWEKQKEILEDFWSEDYQLAVWALGRRSGKTLMASIVAIYAATMLRDLYQEFLRSGEKFYIVSVANTIDQAKISLQNVKHLINSSPILKQLIIRETSDSLELSNGAVFRAMPASSRGGRGLPVPLLIFDELAHAIDSGGNASGDALYQALSPSVAQFGKLGKILMLSSPWISQGIFWDLFKQAKSGNFKHMQAIQLPSWIVNPKLSADFLEQERLRDPELFAVEFGANFSQSLSAFVDSDLIESAVNYERSVLPPQAKYKGRYYLSLDPAKGNRDDYTACIVHYEGERLIVDRWYEFKPSLGEGKKKQVNITEVENWILEQHQLYGFSEVVLDQYNSSATIQKLSNRLNISEISWSSSSKTEAYSKVRELFNSGNIELYPHQKSIQQLKNLTVVYRSSGQWSVSGGTGAAVDDFASALAGSVLKARFNRQIYAVASPPDVDRYGRAVNRASNSNRPNAREIRDFF